ncbi:hypothetical protein [Nannocystis radixulma]|uniref:Uncharacterized protein n=1 Tax=Nannocystis radixulma TaxID=2995305 RepID=A0ABT5B8W0_9BACT|nr:hypothetical protein [Nannocystis radixulma]MDC0670560.1 hypothetical protein [Nannocystis radixulma]
MAELASSALLDAHVVHHRPEHPRLDRQARVATSHAALRGESFRRSCDRANVMWMDELAELREALDAAEARFTADEFVELPAAERDGRTIRVVLTRRFYRLARRARIWRGAALVITLKNARYGFDPNRARSLGGRDGVFLLDRGIDNSMTRKIYGQFFDRTYSGAAEVAAFLSATLAELQAIRLVSHHMRLLGVLYRGTSADWLVIVDFDRRAS